MNFKADSASIEPVSDQMFKLTFVWQILFQNMISFIIPTNREPKHALSVIVNIDEVWGDCEREILVCSASRMQFPRDVTWVKDIWQTGSVAGYNNLYKACHGDIVIPTNDDHHFPLNAPDILKRFEDKHIISFTGEGANICFLPYYCPPYQLIRFPVLPRKTIEKLFDNHIFNPKFNHHYCDNWMSYHLNKKGWTGVEFQDLPMTRQPDHGCRTDQDTHDEAVFKELVESGVKTYAQEDLPVQ